MLRWILIPHLQRILPVRAVNCQTRILRMRRFTRRTGSLGRKRKRKRKRSKAIRKRAIRRDMQMMSQFQTMTRSTVYSLVNQDVQVASDCRDHDDK
jgi:predicted DNA-binding transcriptional regulator AlpA